ncbi:MAG: HlyC/CorC family transporter [Alphaproteobacteria bacterium]|nr:HlyC/CorC family transporter [Alphaproteobacteria bacterium]
MDSLIVFGPIFLLLLFSAFFSGSETAITAASRPRMHQLEQQGSHSARIVNRLRERNERLIGAILLGNNLVNIMASALATSLFIGWFGQDGVAYATVVMTLLVLIFAEVLPKTYAILHADRLSLAVAPILRVVVFLFAPVTHAVHVVVRATLNLFGVRLAPDLGPHSEEELRGAIALHAGPDPEIEHERRMLRSILDLADVEVGEIMTHRSALVMVDADQSAADIVAEVVASPYTRIPMFKEEPDNIVGILHAKALLRAVQAKESPLSREDVVALTTEAWFVPESTSLLDQLHAFRERHEHFALVVDEYGALMGVVTLEDILEEIVGDIADETDVPVRGVRPQPDGSYIVDGWVTIRDLNRQYDWSLPDEDAVTVAGLVMHEARTIPEVGQSYGFHGFRFEILRRHKNRITTVRIRPLGHDRDLEAAAED